MKKLKLNKLTIVNLTLKSLNKIKGGIISVKCVNAEIIIEEDVIGV